jgi:hypothetical protein
MVLDRTGAQTWNHNEALASSGRAKEVEKAHYSDIRSRELSRRRSSLSGGGGAGAAAAEEAASMRTDPKERSKAR